MQFALWQCCLVLLEFVLCLVQCRVNKYPSSEAVAEWKNSQRNWVNYEAATPTAIKSRSRYRKLDKFICDTFGGCEEKNDKLPTTTTTSTTSSSIPRIPAYILTEGSPKIRHSRHENSLQSKKKLEEYNRSRNLVDFSAVASLNQDNLEEMSSSNSESDNKVSCQQFTLVYRKKANYGCTYL